jgi:8-oxo-dGTP pyrophosphatase MutT (NUDIX family)
MYDLFNEIRRSLVSPTLPGWEGQKMMSVIQDAHLRVNVPANAKKAGVLVLVGSSGSSDILLIRRQNHPKDKHSGQLSFPGGKFEPTDRKLLDTAIREANEEVGLTANDFELVGNLSPLYIPVSNFHVFPFVALSHKKVNFNIDLSEVAETLHLPLSAILTRTPQKTNMTLSSGFNLSHVPYFPLNQHKVWGATAMILAELSYILQSNPNLQKYSKNNSDQ